MWLIRVQQTWFTTLLFQYQMVTKELLSAQIKNLHGFLPVYKPKGLNCMKLLFALKSDLHAVLNRHDVKHGEVKLDCARYLEPFASGLITIVCGTDHRRRRNFVHADYRYRFTVELGVERDYHCIDGKILSTSNVDHIPFKLIKEVAKSFVGEHEQRRRQASYDIYDLPYLASLSPDIRIYHDIQFDYKPKAKSSQKYPLSSSTREVSCRSMKLVNYKKPFATFNIRCNGGLSVRELTFEFAKKLGTKASIVEMTRIEEGPMTVNDLRILQLYELNLEYYVQRLAKLRQLYDDYISKYDDRFETEPNPFYNWSLSKP